MPRKSSRIKNKKPKPTAKKGSRRKNTKKKYKKKY